MFNRHTATATFLLASALVAMVLWRDAAVAQPSTLPAQVALSAVGMLGGYVTSNGETIYKPDQFCEEPWLLALGNSESQ